MFTMHQTGGAPRARRFPAHTVDSAPAATRDALAGVERALGFVPALFATMAASPEALLGYMALDSVLAKGSFDPAERQVLLTAVSAANGCVYCTAAHSTFAASLGAEPADIAAARGERDISGGATGALIAFVHAVVHERGHVGPVALNEFIDAGFTPAQALEVVANVGLKTISNFIHGFVPVPLDADFAPHRWEPNAIAAG